MTVDGISEEDWLEEVNNSRAMLTATIAHCQEEHGFTSEQTFLLGFSQGCMMVTDHAWRSEARYAGIIGISGRVIRLKIIPTLSVASAKSRTF